MANVKKFDEEAVLDSILSVFWRQGYEATSLDNLVAATGVKKQSLYNTFGNKEAMFHKAYDHYLAKLEAALAETTEACDGTPMARVRAFVESFVGIATDPASPAGCLVTNSAVEFGYQQDSVIYTLLRDHFRTIEAQLEALIAEAQQAGEIVADRPADELARFLIGTITASAVIFRLKRDAESTRSIVDTALGMLDRS